MLRDTVDIWFYEMHGYLKCPKKFMLNVEALKIVCDMLFNCSYASWFSDWNENFEKVWPQSFWQTSQISRWCMLWTLIGPKTKNIKIKFQLFPFWPNTDLSKRSSKREESLNWKALWMSNVHLDNIIPLWYWNNWN